MISHDQGAVTEAPTRGSHPVSADIDSRARAICEELKCGGITHVAWLPDSETHFMHAALTHDPALTVIPVCREGEAIAICSGLHLGGVRSALLVENQGLFDCGNVLKWAAALEAPIVMLVGWLFYHQMQWSDGGMMFNGRRDYTESFLDALDIQHVLVDSDADVAMVTWACREAFETRQPVAILLAKADDFEAGN